MPNLLRRIHDWAVGPGGWLIDTDINDQLAAVDLELDEMDHGTFLMSDPYPPGVFKVGDEYARFAHITDEQLRQLTYTEGLAGGWHYETGKPWPKHRRPHPLGEDYPE